MPEPSSPTALTGDDLETWSTLATLLEWLPAALDAQLTDDSGLTHFEYGILYALADAPERTLRMSVLAGYANSSLSRLSRATSRLEGKGWVRRKTDDEDGRYTLAILTESGLASFTGATPAHVQTVHRLILDRERHAGERYPRTYASNQPTLQTIDRSAHSCAAQMRKAAWPSPHPGCHRGP
jgi:DNA-binding MarR family transcriptional regulator